MAQSLRLLRHFPPWFQFHFRHHHQFSVLPTPPPRPPPSRRTFSSYAQRRNTPYQTTSSSSRGLRLPNAPLPYDSRESGWNDEEGDKKKKSRNQMKREAQRAVRWGMDLASFSTPQIKRILGVASLEEDVFEALMLVKRLGPDVREGKRRQFNYIGKLLREVEPDLMDALIQATKDGDHSRLNSLSGLGEGNDVVDSAVEEEDPEAEYFDDDDEEPQEIVSLVARWLDGLISKDVEVTREVYSLSTIDFDRQELGKLVRKVQNAQEQQAALEEENGREESVAVRAAKKSLSHFLHILAKELTSDNH